MQIGTTDKGKAFTLPADAATQTFALLARRGAGKTNTAVVMAEEFLDRQQPIIAIDPVGVWYGLRSSYSGKSAGYPILVMGGEHGDVPLESNAGKTVAEFLVHDRVPTILDVSLFGENEMRRFVGEFAAEFYRTNRQAVHVFIDEADEFAPQSGTMGGESGKCLGAMQNLIRRGRARGIGVTLITQRSAVINKSVLNMTECLIALQMTAPQDIEAIDGWLKYHSAKDDRERIMRTLPSFQRGQAWVYSPGWLGSLTQIQVRQRRTFDSSATPKPGEERKQPKTLAEIDLSALSARIRETAEQAKANDPKELKRQIADLRRQVATVQPVKTEVVERSVFTDSDRASLLTLGQIMEDLSKRLNDAARLFTAAKAAASPQVVRREPAAHPVVAHRPRESSNGHGHGYGHERMPKVERLILTALAQHGACDDRKVALLTGYALNGGGFRNGLGSLRTKGWISRGNPIEPTDAGLRALGAFTPLPEGAELVEHWMRQLGKAEREILQVMIEGRGRSMSAEAIASKTPSQYAPDGGGFRNALGRLRGLELIEGRGELSVASELLGD